MTQPSSSVVGHVDDPAAPGTAALEPAALVPAKLQRVVATHDGVVTIEVFAGGKAWLRLGPGILERHPERPASTSSDVDVSLQGLLRKELVPGVISAIDIDDGRGLWRLTIRRPEGPSRVLIIERDGREPRWLLTATTEDGDRILAAVPTSRPTDGRDTRRGRLYEPPRRAPLPHSPAPTSSSMPPATPSTPATHHVVVSATKRIRAEQARIKRLIRHLQEDLARHGDPARLALDGELLKGLMPRLVRGTAHITVVDVDGSDRTIQLDPALDAKGNLEKIFGRARRARTAVTRVAPRLVELEARQASLAELGRRLDAQGGDDTSHKAGPLAELEALLAGATHAPSARRRAALQGPRQPWRSFVVDSGVVVRVGRGAKDNEALVKSARGHDVWLHARDFTGAHVIIPSTGGAVPDAVFFDAAHLAAWFSAARGERHVDLQHTRVKHLKKAGPGGPPGLFMVAHETVTHLRVDDGRTRTLLTQEVAAQPSTTPTTTTKSRSRP